MSNGIKILKVLGGIVEVGFILSFVFEIGKEIGRKEQKEVSAEQNDISINADDLINVLKIDKNTIEKIKQATIK